MVPTRMKQGAANHAYQPLTCAGYDSKWYRRDFQDTAECVDNEQATHGDGTEFHGIGYTSLRGSGHEPVALQKVLCETQPKRENYC